jgi:threonine synthase
MKYISTRGQAPVLGFRDAVATGLASDGGLYLPQQLPDLSSYFTEWSQMSYVELATAFFREFANDIDPASLESIIRDSYTRFDHLEIAPLKVLDDHTRVLELFHGPTLAFKDFALQLLGNLYAHQIEQTGQPINILGATSGDTGAAAIHGLLGKPGIQLFILYPEGGVSPLQEMQMTCTGADNVHPLAIRGSFDDAQHIIKGIFGDLEFRRQHHLAAVNSINLARILAQCIYYFYAWFRLPDALRDKTEFVVPTGNFGNVLAGWLASRMGMPIPAFRVATNQNDILHRLFQSGEYKMGDLHKSYAPSMDIQIASNFERFLYYHENGDSKKVCEVIDAFRRTGYFHFADFRPDIFKSSKADDTQIQSLIGEVYSKYQYIVDPHTACGFADWEDVRSRVVLATAHPAKFPDTIEAAIGQRPQSPTLEALRASDPKKVVLKADETVIRKYIDTYSETT